MNRKWNRQSSTDIWNSVQYRKQLLNDPVGDAIPSLNQAKRTHSYWGYLRTKKMEDRNPKSFTTRLHSQLPSKMSASREHWQPPSSCEFEILDIAKLNIGRLEELRRTIFKVQPRIVVSREEVQPKEAQPEVRARDSRKPPSRLHHYRYRTVTEGEPPRKPFRPAARLRPVGFLSVEQAPAPRKRQPSAFSCGRWKADFDDDFIE